ncbi:MAG: hypothetical protein D6737_12335 [Chloroflexi bacterium]|nr:MAG: hypothetical protein CUN54_01535 [Phototrophicales bacterium]RMF79209.1 MAG: hypothetical protein D6737_12335 [Chloroflexota bacterium]
MFSDINHAISQEYQKDRHRQAEKHRLIKQARMASQERTFYHPFMSWIGRRMVVWGMRLMIQSREWDHRTEKIYMQEAPASALHRVSNR